MKLTEVFNKDTGNIKAAIKFRFGVFDTYEIVCTRHEYEAIQQLIKIWRNQIPEDIRYSDCELILKSLFEYVANKET